MRDGLLVELEKFMKNLKKFNFKVLKITLKGGWIEYTIYNDKDEIQFILSIPEEKKMIHGNLKGFEIYE